MDYKEEEEDKPGKEVQIVVFRLEDAEYAIEIHKVREIIKLTSITPVPRTPDVIKGIINVRGKIVVVIDLKERFDLGNEHEATHIILVETDERILGILVDDISKVIRVDEDRVKEPPDIITDKIHADYIHGIVILKSDRFIILLDVDRLFSEEEWEGLNRAERHGEKEAIKAEEVKKEEEKEEIIDFSITDKKKKSKAKNTKKT